MLSLSAIHRYAVVFVHSLSRHVTCVVDDGAVYVVTVGVLLQHCGVLLHQARQTGALCHLLGHKEQ